MEKRIRKLTDQLNKACEAYYDKGNPIMTDYEFDRLYDELQMLEKKYGIIMPDSPTQKVGWHHVLKKIDDVVLNHPMKSLAKSHTTQELLKFIGNNECYLSVKCDGLSCTLLYENGRFISAATRGNGTIGSDVTNAALAIKNIPKVISYKDRLVIDGEVIIDKKTFASINAKLPLDKQFANPRNLAAGTLTMLDNAVIKERGLEFIAWRVIDGFDDIDSNQSRLIHAKCNGFAIVPMTDITVYTDDSILIHDLNTVRDLANDYEIPYDGVVVAIDSISKGLSLGETDKFPRHSMAYKFEDELNETKLLDIEWNTSKTGLMNPVAVFEDVIIDGTTVNRATLHNPDYIKQLQLGIGDTIVVRKSNMIIPRVEENLTRSDSYVLPEKCSCCGGGVELRESATSHALYCVNPDCPAKLLAKLVHFCSRDAIDIEGLSEATLEVLINKKWIASFDDIFNLKTHEKEWKAIPGFGKKSVDNILTAIEKSRSTTLDRFIYALSIPLIGKSAAKDISKFCDGSFQTFVDTKPVTYKKIDGFGDRMVVELSTYLTINGIELEELAKEFTFKVDNPSDNLDVKDLGLSGITFVITGDVHIYKNRKELQVDIEKHGGKVTGSVSAKTNYLINNDSSSNSSKNLQAKKLGIPIITEEYFLKNLISTIDK